MQPFLLVGYYYSSVVLGKNAFSLLAIFFPNVKDTRLYYLAWPVFCSFYSRHPLVIRVMYLIGDHGRKVLSVVVGPMPFTFILRAGYLKLYPSHLLHEGHFA